MLNLEELVFKVNTKELVDAVTDLKNLSQAVTDLGTKSAGINVKVNKTTTEVKSQAKAVKEATDETNKSTAALQRQQDILNFMTQGFSKGQSSVLAYAKAAGAATSEISELGKVLDRQRTLMGTDPFDKSIGAMKALRNEYTVLREVNRLYNADLNLSKNQVNELAREKLRLIEKLKIEGKSFTDVKNALRDLNIAYIQNANAENTLDANMRRRQKTVQDTAKANEYLAKEMERVNRMLNSTDNITSTTNNKLIRFEQELKRSGMTAAQQTVALEKYKKAILDIQQAGGNRQVDYLSRALGPQITDVFVGLATGQAPLMVLLQQGGQLRDQFALAGVAGADMGKMLTTAAASMITSVKDVAMAVGGLLVNALVATGKAIVNLPVQILKSAADSLSGMLTFVKSGGKDTSALAESFGILSANLSKAALYAGGFAAALGIALIAAIKDTNELNRNLVMTGASLGLTAKDAYSLAQSMDASGVSTFKAVKALSAFAKEGVSPADGSLKDLIKTVVDLESVGGPAVEKTAEKLAEIGKSPVEALAKFAIETGVVDVAILKQVQSLEKQKKYTEAAELAQRSFIEGSKELSATMAANLTPVEKLWISVKKATSDAWSEVKEFANSDTFLAPFKLMLETAWVLVSEVWFVVKAIGKELGGIAAQIVSVLTTRSFDGAKAIREEMIADSKRAREEQDAYTKSIVDGTMFQNREMKRTGQQLKDNSDAARNFMKELKDKDGKTASGSLGVASDNSIANVEKRFNIQLQLAKNFAKDELDIQKAKLDTGLITQEEYYNNTVGLITESEQKQLAVVEQFSVEYEKAVQDRMVQLSSALATTFKNNKGLKEETAKNAEATEQYGQAVENVLTALGTFQEKMQAIKDAAKSSAMVREFQAVAKLHKALQDSTEALRKYSEESTKIQEETSKEFRNLELRVALLGKTEKQQRDINRQWTLQNKLTEIQINLERRLRDIRNDPKLAGNAMDSAVAEYEAIESAKQQRILANQEVAVSAAEDYEKAYKEIQGTLSDIISTALFEGGKAGQKKLKDVLKNAFRNFVINVLINPMIQGGMNLFTNGGSTGSMSGTYNQFSDLSSVAGAGLQAWGGYTAGASSASLAYGNAVGAFGGDALGAMISANGGWAGVSTGGAAAAESAIAANLAAEAGAGVALESGTLALAAEGGATSALSSVAAAMPYIAAILAVVAILASMDDSGTLHTGGIGSYSAAAGFQSGQSSSGLSGYSGTDFSLDAYSPDTAKAGADIAKVVVDILDNTAKTFGQEAGYYAAVGFADDTSDDGAWGQLVVKLGDKMITDWGAAAGDKWPGRTFADGEAGRKQFEEAIGTDLRDIMITQMPEWADEILLKLGDTVSLTQLSSALDQINRIQAVFKEFGMILPNFTNLTEDAKGALMGMAGGVDNLSSFLSSYYTNYYSESERAAFAVEKLTTEFDKLGFALPTSTGAFRKLVEAQDLNTEAGRKTYAALISLNGAFKSAADTAIESAKAMQSAWAVVLASRNGNADQFSAQAQINNAWSAFEATGNRFGIGSPDWFKTITYEDFQNYTNEEQQLISQILDGYAKLDKIVERVGADAGSAWENNLKNAMAVLNEAIGKEKELYQAQYNHAKAIYDMTSTAVRELRNEVDSTAAMQTTESRTYIRDALAQMQVDGTLPDSKILDRSINEVRASISGATYKSKVESDKARIEFSNELEAIANLAGPQMTTAELQLETLNNILAEQKRLNDALLGVSTGGPKTIEEAIALLEAARVKPTTPVTGGSGSSGSGSTGGSSSGSGGFVVGGGGGGGPIYETQADRLAGDIAAWEAAGKDWTVTYLPGVGPVIVGGGAGSINSTQEKWLKDAGVPGFANGGAFTNGIVSEPTAFNMAVMGEAGSEAIMPLTNVGGSLGVRATNDPSLVEAIDRMNSNLEMLRSEIRADVSHNAKTSRLLDRVIQDGRTISVTADLDGGTI